jgi:hypothetical protein
MLQRVLFLRESTPEGCREGSQGWSERSEATPLVDATLFPRTPAGQCHSLKEKGAFV